MKDTKFRVGDNVRILSSNEEGQIIKIASYLGGGNNLYLLSVNGRNRMFSENNISLIKKGNMALHIDVKDLSLRLDIDTQIDKMVKGLNYIKNSTSVYDDLKNACVIQRCLIEYGYKDKKIVNTGKDVWIDTLYHSLFDGEVDNIGMALLFYSLAKKIGLDVKVIVMNDENNEYYLSNLVKLGDKYFYFDAFLEKSIYEERKSKDYDLRCIALGSSSYEKFFKPLGILYPDNEQGRISNVADSDCATSFIQSAIGVKL